jgi:hypothetical protein
VGYVTGVLDVGRKPIRIYEEIHRLTVKKVIDMKMLKKKKLDMYPQTQINMMMDSTYLKIMHSQNRLRFSHLKI